MNPAGHPALPPVPALLRSAGLLVRSRTDRAVLEEALTAMGFSAHDLTRVDSGEGAWGAVDLLLVDETSAPAYARAVAEAKRRVEPAFLPALVVVPRVGSAERWLRAGFDDVVRLPIPPEELRGRLAVHLRLRARTLDAERAVFDRLPLGLFRANGKGEITLANPAMASLLGFSSPDELFRAGSLLEGLCLPGATDHFRAARKGDGSIHGVELPWVRPDGTLVWIRWTGKLHLDAGGNLLLAEGAAEDVTERRRVEQALEDARSLQAATVDSLGAALAILGPDGSVRSGNALWRKGAHRPGGDPRLGVPVGSNYLRVWRRARRRGDRAAPAAVEGISRVLEGAAPLISLEFSVPSGDGEEETPSWFRMRVTPLQAGSSHPGGAVVTLVDVTREWEAREALRRREEELRQAQKMEAVGRLAGGIAHDFNNLLTAIHGNAALLKAAGLGPRGEAPEELEEIVRAAERATALTRQLLVLSRRQVSQPGVVDLREVVESTRGLLSRLMRADIHLELEQADTPLEVEADPRNLEMALLNLALNARDAMPRGGRMVVRTLRSIPGVGLPPGDPRAIPHAVLEVADSGTGMTEEVRRRIFEPFFTTKAEGEGTGLGLSVVQGIVDQLGGRIEVESRPGQGSTFRILLPLAILPPQAGAARETGGGLPEGDGFALPRSRPGETILLVEDDVQVRRPTSRLLSRVGYRVLEAADGLEGLEILRAGNERVDLVLSDVVMPRMTGPEMIRRFREELRSEGRREPRILFISGYAEREIDFFTDRSGSEPPRLVPKPFDFPALARIIRETLDGDREPDGEADPTAGPLPPDRIPSGAVA